MVNQTGQAGDPSDDEFLITRRHLVEAIEAELHDYFFDGCALTLAEYEIRRIAGGIICRVEDSPSEANK